MSINVNNVLDAVNFLFYGYNFAVNALVIVRKTANYDSKRWKTHDYVEVIARVSTLASDMISFKHNWKRIQVKNEIQKIEKEIDAESNSKTDIEELRANLQKAKEAFDLIKMQVVKATAAGAIGFFIAETSTGKSVLEVLQEEEALSRLGITLSGLGNIYNSDALALSARAISTYRTGKNALGAFPILASGIVNLYRRIARQNHLTMPPSNLNYRMIPQQHQNNPIFSRHICLFAFQAIRYPVCIRDANGNNHYYELAAIHHWVNNNGTNPLTHQPLITNNLIVDANALNQIENEMIRLGIPLV